MIAVSSLLAIVSLFTIALVIQRRLRQLDNECRYWENFANLQYQQRLNEQRRRLIYERALALPLGDPQRTEELWTRAQQGDELAEWILLEQMASEMEGYGDRRPTVYDQYSDQ